MLLLYSILRLLLSSFHNLEPLVFKSALSIKSLLRVEDEEFADKVLTLIGNSFELSMVEMVIGLLNLTEDFMRIVSLKWQIATDKSVEKDTKRPEIGFLTVGAVKNLRSHIVRRASDGCQLFVAFGSLR